MLHSFEGYLLKVCLVAFSTNDNLIVGLKNGALVIWEFATEGIAAILRKRTGSYVGDSMAHSPDGTLAFSPGREVSVWSPVEESCSELRESVLTTDYLEDPFESQQSYASDRLTKLDHICQGDHTKFRGHPRGVSAVAFFFGWGATGLSLI